MRAGKYKDLKGSAACADCPADTYSVVTGGKSASICTKSNSPSGSSAATACTGVNVLEAQHSQLSHDTQVALADRVTR